MAGKILIHGCPGFNRKASKRHRIVALKAVAHKIARGCYHALRDQVPFDLKRAFG